MEIINKKTSSLIPYEKNQKKHPKEQIDKIKKSIEEFGFSQPIVIDKDNVIIAGHGRHLAAVQLDIKEVPCLVKDDLTVQQIKAYRIMDNKSAESDWDFDLLKEEFEQILDGNYDINFTGFDHDEFREIMGFEDKELKDPFVSVKSIKTDIKKGDIIKLGEHKVMCGDCTYPSEVQDLLGEEKVDSLVTDPPYNVDYSSKNDFLNKLDKGNRNQKPIENDNIKNFEQFLTNFLSVIPFQVYNTAYTFMSYKEIAKLINAYDKAGLYYSQELKWIKNNHVLGRSDYAPKCENIIYGWKGKHKFYGGFTTDVLEFPKPQKSEEHPTMKPVELIAKLIKDGSQEGMNIYDPFGGSGTTLIACEQLKRKCYMMEIDPKYCEVICQRWEKLTGKKREVLKNDN